MEIVYSNTEFKPGTLLRRIFMYDEDGDIIMTDEPMYEELPDETYDYYDGPEDDEPEAE